MLRELDNSGIAFGYLFPERRGIYLRTDKGQSSTINSKS
jgi:hypothetical protein